MSGVKNSFIAFVSLLALWLNSSHAFYAQTSNTIGNFRAATDISRMEVRVIVAYTYTAAWVPFNSPPFEKED
jgi:hypothetical protein